MASIGELLGQRALLQRGLLGVQGGTVPEQKKTTAIVLHQQSSPSQLVNGYKPDPTSLGEQVQKEGVCLHHALLVCSTCMTCLD